MSKRLHSAIPLCKQHRLPYGQRDRVDPIVAPATRMIDDISTLCPTLARQQFQLAAHLPIRRQLHLPRREQRQQLQVEVRLRLFTDLISNAVPAEFFGWPISAVVIAPDLLDTKPPKIGHTLTDHRIEVQRRTATPTAPPDEIHDYVRRG